MKGLVFLNDYKEEREEWDGRGWQGKGIWSLIYYWIWILIQYWIWIPYWTISECWHSSLVPPSYSQISCVVLYLHSFCACGPNIPFDLNTDNLLNCIQMCKQILRSCSSRQINLVIKKTIRREVHYKEILYFKHGCSYFETGLKLATHLLEHILLYSLVQYRPEYTGHIVWTRLVQIHMY